jgi:hypothetical protein
MIDTLYNYYFGYARCVGTLHFRNRPLWLETTSPAFRRFQSQSQLSSVIKIDVLTPAPLPSTVKMDTAGFVRNFGIHLQD